MSQYYYVVDGENAVYGGFDNKDDADRFASLYLVNAKVLTSQQLEGIA